MLFYGLETVATTKRQETELEVAQMWTMRWSLGVTRLDTKRNEHIQERTERHDEGKTHWYAQVTRGTFVYGRGAFTIDIPAGGEEGG